MTYDSAKKVFPRWVTGHVYHFEELIERGVEDFARSLPAGSRVLDAGAGEARHGAFFQNHRYLPVDLAVGDPSWDYGRLAAVADLGSLPFRSGVCDAALMIVTIEHLREPGAALSEIARVMKPGGRVLIAAPHQWEVHQAPNDYFRYTRYGLEYLLGKAGLAPVSMVEAGGLFRMLSRRLLSATLILPWWLKPLGFVLFAIPALVLPLLDGFDRGKDYTLGYICIAQKPSPPHSS